MKFRRHYTDMSYPFTINGRFLQQQVTGVQRVAREVLAELDRLATRGDIATPRLLVPRKGEIIAPPTLARIRIDRCGRLAGHAWEQLELPFYAGTDPLLCLGNTAPAIRLHQRSRPVVVMVHDLSYKYFPSAYSWQFRSLYGALMPHVLGRADRLVTVSASEKIMIEGHYPALLNSVRLSVLQNGGVPDAVAESAGQDIPAGPEARKIGLYVGSLTKRKNAEGVLAAGIAFLRRYSDMRFVVIGATAESFEDVSLNVPEEVIARFEFLGQVNNPETIYAYYRQARFLLFPSYYESSGLPPMEAMAFGCPTVASHIPALVERCGDAAAFCNPSEINSINAAIEDLMDQQIWTRKSAAGLARARDYRWEDQARGLCDLCAEVA
jgi:glycosyltransferase involved in cell wall biosynthesis